MARYTVEEGYEIESGMAIVNGSSVPTGLGALKKGSFYSDVQNGKFYKKTVDAPTNTWVEVPDKAYVDAQIGANNDFQEIYNNSVSGDIAKFILDDSSTDAQFFQIKKFGNGDFFELVQDDANSFNHYRFFRNSGQLGLELSDETGLYVKYGGYDIRLPAISTAFSLNNGSEDFFRIYTDTATTAYMLLPETAADYTEVRKFWFDLIKGVIEFGNGIDTLTVESFKKPTLSTFSGDQTNLVLDTITIADTTHKTLEWDIRITNAEFSRSSHVRADVYRDDAGSDLVSYNESSILTIGTDTIIPVFDVIVNGSNNIELRITTTLGSGTYTPVMKRFLVF